MLYNPPTGGAANDPYVGKNVAAGIQGSKVPPGAAEFPQREIVAVIAASGQSPTNTDLTQLLKATRSGLLEFYADTGTADALIITPSPAFTSITDGMEFVVAKKAASGANATATPSLAVNGISQVIVKEDGSAPAVGDLPIGCLFTARSLSGQFRILGLRKSDAASLAPVHIGHDTGTTAAQIVLTTVTGAIPSNPDKHIFVIDVANACAGATTAMIPGLNGGAAVNVLRNDGTPLQSGDYAAAERIMAVSDGTALRLVRLTINEVLALVASSSTVTNAIYNLSPGGLRRVSASAGLQQQSDISPVPNYTTILSTGSFTGASFAQCGGACALHNTTGSAYSGGTVRFALVDETNSAVVTSPYVGGGATTAGTQLPFTVPNYVFTGLNRSHTYHVSIYGQRGTGDGAQSTWDPSIFVQHDGN